jgi:hypothetical protein
MNWIKRTLLRGWRPMVVGQITLAIITLAAMAVSIVIILFVFGNGGLVGMLGRFAVIFCLETGASLDSFYIFIALAITLAIQTSIMIARGYTLSEQVSGQVQTDLEDADLLAAMIGEKDKV